MFVKSVINDISTSIRCLLWLQEACFLRYDYSRQIYEFNKLILNLIQFSIRTCIVYFYLFHCYINLNDIDTELV